LVCIKQECRNVGRSSNDSAQVSFDNIMRVDSATLLVLQNGQWFTKVTSGTEDE